MKAHDIQCVFHYVPLHSSPKGRTGWTRERQLAVTDDVADRLVRLPMWMGLDEHLDASSRPHCSSSGRELSGR